MREKKTYLVVSFYTTSAAMETEKRCRANGLPGKLIPVPRHITADCGYAWRGDTEQKETLQALLSDLEVEGWYEIES